MWATMYEVLCCGLQMDHLGEYHHMCVSCDSSSVCVQLILKSPESRNLYIVCAPFLDSLLDKVSSVSSSLQTNVSLWSFCTWHNWTDHCLILHGKLSGERSEKISSGLSWGASRGVWEKRLSKGWIALSMQAKGLLAEYQPKHFSARAVYRERKKYCDRIDANMLAVPPTGSYKASSVSLIFWILLRTLLTICRWN